MVKTESIVAMNKRLVKNVRREAKENPRSPYAGRIVGIANGKVDVVADTLREVMASLRKIEPDPAKCYGVDTTTDYDRVEYV